MVLPNLWVGRKQGLRPGQLVSLEQLDGWLDVVSARFPTVVRRLADEFARRRGTLDRN